MWMATYPSWACKSRHCCIRQVIFVSSQGPDKYNIRVVMQFADGAFDVAFDKGGLDALMGDEGADADAAGARREQSAQLRKGMQELPRLQRPDAVTAWRPATD